MDDIRYTTPEEQVKKLKKQNLIISDDKYAEEMLQLCGYSNLIKSYRAPYFITVGEEKSYRSGVTFEQILSLYTFDKSLRNGVMAAMQDLEEHIKEQASDVVASAFGTHQDEYLQYRNYQNRRKRIQRFTLTGLLETMRKTLDTDKDPIHHYKTAHGIVPPWILFKSIYFSTMVNFIDQFKGSELAAMAHRLYDLEKLGITEEQARTLMMETLYFCIDYRNMAAHGGRIYNYKAKRGMESLKEFEKGTESSFIQLLFVLSLLKYQEPYRRLERTMNAELTRHCNAFPQDVTYLGQVMNMDIVSQKVVYATEKGMIYHKNPHCSGLNDVHMIDAEEAKRQGLKPCKRCVKDNI